MEKQSVDRKCPLFVQIRQFAAISCSVPVYFHVFACNSSITTVSRRIQCGFGQWPPKGMHIVGPFAVFLGRLEVDRGILRASTGALRRKSAQTIGWEWIRGGGGFLHSSLWKRRTPHHQMFSESHRHRRAESGFQERQGLQRTQRSSLQRRSGLQRKSDLQRKSGHRWRSGLQRRSDLRRNGPKRSNDFYRGHGLQRSDGL
jgi:hypothetical protein